MILTLWQTTNGLRLARSGERRMDDPTREAFEGAFDDLVSAMAADAVPFQVVAQVGSSSRAVQLEPGWDAEAVKARLWAGYRGLVDVIG